VELLRDGRSGAPLSADHAERHEAAYVHELEHFGEVVMGRRAPRATGEDAVAALELAQLAARSAELGVPLAAGAGRPCGAAGAGRHPLAVGTARDQLRATERSA
jgi:predicted dehydrogenase